MLRVWRKRCNFNHKWQVEMVFIRFAAMARINFNFPEQARELFFYIIFFLPCSPHALSSAELSLAPVRCGSDSLNCRRQRWRFALLFTANFWLLGCTALLAAAPHAPPHSAHTPRATPPRITRLGGGKICKFMLWLAESQSRFERG